MYIYIEIQYNQLTSIYSWKNKICPYIEMLVNKNREIKTKTNKKIQSERGKIGECVEIRSKSFPTLIFFYMIMGFCVLSLLFAILAKGNNMCWQFDRHLNAKVFFSIPTETTESVY